MANYISYTNDVFFKYALGSADVLSMELRKRVLETILDIPCTDIKVLNPEIVPEILAGKRIHLDLLLHNAITGEKIAIEMQASDYTSYQSKRFQFYGSRLLVKGLKEAQYYNSLHHIYQIIFIKGKNPYNNSLINCFKMCNQDGHEEPYNLITRIYVHISVINDIVLHKGLSSLNDFEMFCYLLENNNENDILELKEGMARILMEKHKEFNEDNELWSWAQAIEDGIVTERSEKHFERQEGRKEGELCAKREVVLTLLEQHFGTIPQYIQSKIELATMPMLNSIIDSILFINTIDEVEEKL